MGLVRDIPFVMRAAEDTILVTCSDIMSTAGSTAAVGIRGSKTTASAVVSTGTLGALSTDARSAIFAAGMASFNGRIIDRTRFPLGANYIYAAPSASLVSTRGSTEVNRKLAVGVKLQHGDSSGGGDLADFSTANQPSDRQYFSSARSTDGQAWDASESTGTVYAVSNPAVYDLTAAKRYLRVVGRFGKDAVTTESSADEQSRVGLECVFFAGDKIPQRADSTSPFSTSTST